MTVSDEVLRRHSRPEGLRGLTLAQPSAQSALSGTNTANDTANRVGVNTGFLKCEPCSQVQNGVCTTGKATTGQVMLKLPLSKSANAVPESL